MDEDERALLAQQNEFLASKKSAAASVVRQDGREANQESVKEDIPGERLALNLDAESPPAPSQSHGAGNIIKEIVEHDYDQTHESAFEAPAMAKAAPRPKKIDWRTKASRPKGVSRFAAGRAAARPQMTEPQNLHQQIDEENQRKLRDMTLEEIEAEKKELLSTLDPQLVKMLEKRRLRSQLDQTRTDESDFGPQFTSQNIASIPKVESAIHRTPQSNSVESNEPMSQEIDDEEYTSIQEALQEQDQSNHVHTDACLSSSLNQHDSDIHFPAGPNDTDLEPSSDTFLDDLKQKYFPTLSHDPSSLAWMKRPTEAEDMADYHESQASLMPAQLRFDFQGNLVAPRTSREVDGHLGLHHHADAPLAAGYTVPEVAHLSRSSFPSQACMAMQIAGRIMYKVGKKFYGDSISGKVQGLVEKSQLEKTLLERSGDRHLGVRSYATEALWQANLGREGQIIEGA